MSSNEKFDAHYDIERLISFLQILELELEIIFNRFEKIVPEYPKMRLRLLSDWQSIKTNFESARNDLKERKPVLELQKHGLTGKQLDLKLEFFQIIREQNIYAETIHDAIFDDPRFTQDQKEIGITDRIRDPFRKLERRIKKKLLEVACIILGSLDGSGISFIGLINEFKDLAGNFIEE